jgi:branched-chain amino acid transport system ATP-binding protein
VCVTDKLILAVQEVDAGYGDIQILRGLSLSVMSNDHVGLFGPNGHGKTTLLETISGLQKPWGGEIIFKGESITGLTPAEILDLGIVHVPQGNTLFPNMTILENLHVGAYSKKNWPYRKRRLEQVFSIFPKLAERKRQVAYTLSGGERQMLALGVGLMARCELLLLDEPSLGLSPIAKEELGDSIQEITNTGINLILVEQDFDFMSGLTDHYYRIEGGRVIHDSTKERMSKSEITKMYFGNGRK